MSTTSRARRSARRTAVGAAILSLALVASACDQAEVTDANATHGLLILAGDVRESNLTVRDTADPDGRDVVLPGPTAWIAVGRANVLAANLVDGTLHVSGTLRGSSDLEWRPVSGTTVTGDPPDGPLYFATWDPDGGAFAVLAARFSDGDGLRAVVVDPGLDQAAEFPLDAVPVVGPPAWIDGDRLVVVTGEDRRRVATILDVTTGETSIGPAGVRLLAVSADTTTVAVWSGDGPIAVHDTEAWLAEDGPTTSIAAPNGVVGPAAIALDRNGGRLAIVWADRDGLPASVTIHVSARGWARAATIPLRGVRAAMVAWLR
jgi:hypothetical protein